MAEIDAAFVADIKTVSALKALVGAKVYAHEAGKDAIDSYIVVIPTTNQRGRFIQTAYGGTARLSVYCYGRTKAKAESIGNAIITAYKSKNGSIGSGTATATVEWIEISNARLLYGPNNEFRYLVDLIVHYT